jgi:putative Holliday junction resolvase
MIDLVEAIANTCPKNVRLLGLDLGTKTIGVAISNEDQTISTPIKTIDRKKFTADLNELSKIAKDFAIGGIILGWPMNMDGTPGPRCDATRSFADELSKYPQELGMKEGTDMWIGLWDERLSTHAVEDFLVKDVDMSRTKRKQVVDKLAAQIILQGALDYLQVARG